MTSKQGVLNALRDQLTEPELTKEQFEELIRRIKLLENDEE